MTARISDSSVRRFCYSPVLLALALALSLALPVALIFSGKIGAEEISAGAREERGTQTRIERVEIVSQNVFSDSAAANFWVYKFLNRFHVPTRIHIIRREALLNRGDLYDPELAQETERTLRSLPFIFDAWVTLDTSVADSATLRIRTIDKWSLSGGVQFVRKLGRNRLEVGVNESNFLGLGHQIGIKYIIPDSDPNFWVLGYSNSRFLGRPYRVAIQSSSNPLDKLKELTLQRSFVRQSDRLSYGVRLKSFNSRSQRVSDGDTSLTFFESGQSVSANVSHRSGGYNLKYPVGLVYRYTDQRSRDIVFQTSGEQLQAALASLPVDSVYHSLSLSLSALKYVFKRSRHIDFLGRTEDVTLLSGGGVSLGQARGVELGDLLYTTWGVNALGSFVLAGTIVQAGLAREGWVADGSEIRSILSATIKAHNTSMNRVTLAGRFSFLQDKRAEDDNTLALDEEGGLRGYPAYFRTGDRRLVGNFEIRFFPELEILTARMGPILHFDGGAIWSRDEKLTFADLVWSAGGGLRFDLGRAGSGRVIRADISYAHNLRSWQISTGIRQFFQVK